MFSVGATPFNSRRRQLYGGWANVYAPANSTVESLKAYYADNPSAFAYDSKWANMALKYSDDRADIEKARLIKKASYQMLKEWRKIPGWGDSYNVVQARFRTAARKPPLSTGKRKAAWLTFRDYIPQEDLSEAQAQWLSFAGNAPYTSVPTTTVAGLSPADLDMFAAGPTALPGTTRYIAPARGEQGYVSPLFIPRGVIRPGAPIVQQPVQQPVVVAPTSGDMPD